MVNIAVGNSPKRLRKPSKSSFLSSKKSHTSSPKLRQKLLSPRQKQLRMMNMLSSSMHQSFPQSLLMNDSSTLSSQLRSRRSIQSSSTHRNHRQRNRRAEKMINLQLQLRSKKSHTRSRSTMVNAATNLSITMRRLTAAGATTTNTTTLKTTTLTTSSISMTP